jgi:hypothetical protein
LAAASDGAVNVTTLAEVLLRVTGEPAVWNHSKVSAPPSPLVLAAPLSVTSAPASTNWSGPAFDSGPTAAASIFARTSISTVSSDSASPSLTRSMNTITVSASTSGAVKLVTAASSSSRVAVTSPAAVHSNDSSSPSGSLLTVPSSVTCSPFKTA